MSPSNAPTDIAKSVGTELKRLREDRDLTQVMLSARLQSLGMVTGSSSKTISAWERGDTPLPLPALPVLAEAFRMEPAALARRLGLCGDTAGRETRIAECADILDQLADEPPEFVESVMNWFRTTIELGRMARQARTN